MSAFSDNATITGDGSNSTTLALATKSVTTVAAMQDYDGPATLIQVADPYQGGTFHYVPGNSFISGSFTFNGATITPIGHPNIFTSNQTVYISGTSNPISGAATPNYDGRYKVTAPNSTKFDIIRSFATENHNATISTTLLQASLSFSCAPDPITFIPTVTIFNEDFAGTPSKGFLINHFYAGQIITVTYLGTGNYKRNFTITTVNDDTITASVEDIIAGSESNVPATISTVYTAMLGFNNGGTALQTINDNTSGLKDLFRVDQIIQISGTTLNDGLYKISDLTENTTLHSTQLIITSTFPVTSTQTATITTTDGGLTFPAISKGSGMWRRQYDPKDGLNVTWFGAKGNALFKSPDGWLTKSGGPSANDDTRSVQQALNVAASNKLAINKVVIPPGMYLHSTLYVPSGVLLTGTGAIVESLGTGTSRLIMKAGGGDSLRFVNTGVDHATTSRRFWYGGVTNLEFLGEFTNPTGWAISFNDPTIDNPTNSIAPQDMNFFENLMIRSYPEGGMNFPDCAVPLNVRNIKVMPVGGPAIFISNSKASSGQSINLDNVSCDHNVGGGIWLDKLDDRVSVIITNLKSEGGNNPLNSNLPDCQRNAIICSDCVDTPIIIDNANHQNVSNVIGAFIGNPTIDIDGTDYQVTINTNVLTTDAIRFYSAGKLPKNIIPGNVYYPLTDATAGTAFKITDHVSTIAVAPDDTKSGIHLLYRTPDADPRHFQKPGDLVSIEKLIGVSQFAPGGVITMPAGSIPATYNPGDPHRDYPGTGGLALDNAVKFYSKSALPLPANIVPGRTYYVSEINSVDKTFKIKTLLGAGGVVVDTSLGDSTAEYRVYKQINPADDVQLPKINWRGASIRVRGGDQGTDPVIIAQTGIPYKVSEGKLNITQQVYKSKVTFGPSASLSTPVINLTQNAQIAPQGGDFWYDGTNLKFATSPTNIKSLPTIIDVAEQPYTGTITWAPALSPPPPATATIFPPSGTTNHSYQWTQVGKMVTVRFNLSYQTAGAGQTTCTLTFPSDLPAPLPPNGFSIGHTLYAGSAGFLTSLAGGIGVARCNIHSQATGVNRLDVYFTGNVAPLAVLATITYWAA